MVMPVSSMTSRWTACSSVSPVSTKPANNKTSEHDVLYRANRLAITQELVFSDDKMWRIDLAIFLNGFPIVTVELKNTLSNQTHHNAIKQYMTDRPAKDGTLLQFKRCLVHFAVGSEQAFMTTRSEGDDTRFFPFNQCAFAYISRLEFLAYLY